MDVMKTNKLVAFSAFGDHFKVYGSASYKVFNDLDGAATEGIYKISNSISNLPLSRSYYDSLKFEQLSTMMNIRYDDDNCKFSECQHRKYQRSLLYYSYNNTPTKFSNMSK